MEIKVLDKVFFRISQVENALGDIWLIHPFGESGLCYLHVFESDLVKKYNLFVPDLPGFGVSPNYGKPLGVGKLVDVLKSLIEKNSPNRNLYLIGHSVSGIIVTELIQKLQQEVNGYISVEGNLTTADSYYSSLPIHHSKEDFYRIYLDSVREHAKTRADFQRYLASVRFADVDSLYELGKSTEGLIRDNQAGKAFMSLDCQKLYIWGDKDTPVETVEFIRENDVPNILLKGVGHWPMVEVADKFYRVVGDFISGLSNID
ncbi:MAG: alpha/beta hydrolase [Bacteroidota bacterium]